MECKNQLIQADINSNTLLEELKSMNRERNSFLTIISFLIARIDLLESRNKKLRKKVKSLKKENKLIGGFYSYYETNPYAFSPENQEGDYYFHPVLDKGIKIKKQVEVK